LKPSAYLVIDIWRPVTDITKHSPSITSEVLLHVSL